MASSPLPPGAPNPRFFTTSWSVVLRAGARAESRRPAMEVLCGSYWYPLYAYCRRRGTSAGDAEDAVQSFFTHFIEKDVVSYAREGKGRFRGFLVAAFRQYLAGRHEYETAAKRRPATPPVSIDAVVGESRYSAEPAGAGSPEDAYERAWAVAVVGRAMDRLKEEQEADGKGGRFAALRGAMAGAADESFATLGAGLGLSEGAARVAVHRLRRRYADLLREEVAATLGEGESVDDELRSLMAALGGA